MPGARHRDAWAVEQKSPSAAEAARLSATVDVNTNSATRSSDASISANDRQPQRRIVTSTPAASATNHASTTTNFGGQKIPREVLVIASRLKEYITARSDYNTSGSVMDVLSDHLRILCDRAIDNARADGRKTVMDRDFEFLKNLK